MSILATFDLEPLSQADALAVQLSTGMDGGPPWAHGKVLDASRDGVVVELPVDAWGGDLTVLVSAVVAGEAMEMRELTRCRLTRLVLPDGLLPGPALGADGGRRVGVIVKPSIGLSPSEVADLVRVAVEAGATFVKDDEVLADPPWCPLDDRVKAVAGALEPGVTYCANVTGPPDELVERARRVVDLGATGVMVSAFAQGLAAVLALRRAALGVPVLGHRAGSGPCARNSRYGAEPDVLAALTRLAGADLVIVGAFGGKLFESDAQVEANLRATRAPLGGALASVAVLGGGLGPQDVAPQFEEAGGDGLVALLGSRAHAGPGGLAAAVRSAVTPA